MTPELWLAVGGVILAGLLQGMFAVPMKYAPKWSYENTWLAFCISGMVVLPWMLTTITVPHVGQVYSSTSAKTLFSIAGFGVCWGIGATLTGIGLSMLGIGLGMAIILGLCASVGSLIPLLVLTPQQIHTPQGHTYLIGTAIMLLGIAVSARAGILRDAARNKVREGSAPTSFWAGFIVCCLSGLLSSALNFSYAFGSEAVQRARESGTSSLWATGVVTALAVTGGFAANLLYCSYLLRKNRSVHKFTGEGAARGWLLGGLMGFFWFGGQALYGLGISHMGSLGVVIGWPLLMGMIILTSNAAGVVTGEWAGVSIASKRFLAAGMVIILIALGVLAVAQRA
ncbi:MAG TPA: L-rhamnose/proton symporter RhaT [Terriglobales bacterium]|jgi:L-rhamnose-H+ transport protein|nr:L-rhamnose/proton symporter RhaT [Terriglobales bacterium]